MRFILISILTVFFAVGALMVLISRTVVPPMVEAEKRELVEILPLVRSAAKLTLAGSAPEAGFKRLKHLSGLDVTILNSSGIIRHTTLDNGALAGSKLSVGEKGATVFEMVSIADVPSFVVSAPLRIENSLGVNNGEQELILAISKPDELIGKFFDELFTNVILVGFLGIAASVPVGLYQKRKSRPASFSLAPVSEALSALARKDFSYRMRENVGDDSFRRAQEAFNNYMDEMSMAASPRSDAAKKELYDKTPDQSVPPASLGAAERAFHAALESINEGIVIVEQSGKITAFNRKMEELTGLDADVVSGKLLTETFKIVRKGGEEATGVIPRILSTGVSEVFPEDLMIRRRDGTFVPVAVKAVAIRKDLRGAVTHLVVVINSKEKQNAKPAVIVEKHHSQPLMEKAEAEEAREKGYVPPARPVGPVMDKQVAAANTDEDSERLPTAVSAKLPAAVSEKLEAVTEYFPKAALQISAVDNKENHGAPMTPSRLDSEEPSDSMSLPTGGPPQNLPV